MQKHIIVVIDFQVSNNNRTVVLRSIYVSAEEMCSWRNDQHITLALYVPENNLPVWRHFSCVLQCRYSSIKNTVSWKKWKTNVSVSFKLANIFTTGAQLEIPTYHLLFYVFWHHRSAMYYLLARQKLFKSVLTWLYYYYSFW